MTSFGSGITNLKNVFSERFNRRCRAMAEETFEVPESTEWMSATDAAAELKISRQQLNKQIRWGLFPSTERVGNSFLLKIEEVERVRKDREKQARQAEVAKQQR